ncbi:MAG TPA: hypothetical protein VFW65_18250 [Pseudonocardiaceae bacterium]|nr:hypothetical protein [Pseudonocardiaceae bacterium]
MNRHVAFTLGLVVGALVTAGVVGGLGTPAAGAADATTGSTYFPLTAVRLLDTRTDHAILHAGGVAAVRVVGVDGIPAGVTAAILNVTVVDGTTGSFLTVYPDGASRPATSNLNWVAGQSATPNLVTVPVGGDGKIDLFNAHGNVDVIADLEGYFAGGAVSPPITTLPKPTTTQIPPPTTTTTPTTLPPTAAPTT